MDANTFQVTEKADQMIQQFFQEKKEKADCSGFPFAGWVIGALSGYGSG